MDDDPTKAIIRFIDVPYRRLVYVAGPYSSAPIENTRAALMVGDKLWELGYAPFVPHLTMLWHMVSPKCYEEWMAIDRPWLRVCEAMFRIRGVSAGADREELIFLRQGRPVFYDLPRMLDEFPADGGTA